MLDAGPAPDLQRLLRCGLDRDEILRAAARWVACNPARRVTVRTVVEAWEGNALGLPNAGFESFLDVPRGCTHWTCAATIDACSQLDSCLQLARPSTEACMDGARACFGELSAECQDGEWLTVDDCGFLGATCRDGEGCVRDDCTIGSLRCAGDVLELCEGALSVSCDEGCGTFLVSGEPPVAFCSDDADVAGAFPESEILCDPDSTIAFRSVNGEFYDLRCSEAGFSGCDDRGCVE